MSQIQYLDELIKEYLLFRGFTTSLKSFDSELKQDKDKAFRTDKVLDQLLHYMSTYDLNSLRELWNHLDQRMFSKLDSDLAHGVKKLENSVLKLYLVNACVNNKSDKVAEFFTKMTPEIHGQADWKEWFALAYLKNPEESSYFSVYFSKHWQDTLIVSLHNFLSLISQNMVMPVLANYEDEANRVHRLMEENETLKQKLTTLSQCTSAIIPSDTLAPPQDLMDDFYIIAQETPASGESQGKSIKNLMRNIGGGGHTSPIMTRKHSHQDEGGRTLLSKVQRAGAAGSSGQPTWIKHAGGDSVPKRSLSLDSRRRGREDSVERNRPANKKDNFLLLSQEKLNDHKAGVSQCKFSSTGTYVASGDLDGILKVWTYAPQPKVVWSMEAGRSIAAVDWLGKNERYLVVGTTGGLLKLYDTSEKKPVWEIGADSASPLKDTRIVSLCASLSESHIACTTVNPATGRNSRIFLIDVKTAAIEYCLKLGRDEAEGLVSDCCVFNHTGSLVVCGCSDGSIRTLDMRYSECLDLWDAHTGPVSALHLTPDLNTCFSFGSDHKLCRHNMAQNGDPMWSAALPKCCGVTHGTQAFALHQSGSHALVTCGVCPPNIYQVSNTGLLPVLSLGDHGRAEVVACDWASANQCSTCVSAYSDGKIKISTILTP